MGRNIFIVGYNELRSVVKHYVNAVNAISTLFKTAPPTNIITNNNTLTQYRIKQGIKVFGKKGEDELIKELHNFHYRRVVEPKKPQDLSYEQKIRSLSYLTFMKLKNDEVTIKGRGCAYGKKQREWISKEYTSSPTMSTKGLVL